MNKEDYVSLEVAKLLKEKGFDEDCMAFYTRDGLFECNSYINTNVLKHPTPTLYEAQKWLRDRHKIHISVGMCSDYSTNADGDICDEWTFWAFSTYYTTTLHHIHDCFGEYDTYEEALNAGILEALKLIE